MNCPYSDINWTELQTSIIMHTCTNCNKSLVRKKVGTKLATPTRMDLHMASSSLARYRSTTNNCGLRYKISGNFMQFLLLRILNYRHIKYHDASFMRYNAILQQLAFFAFVSIALLFLALRHIPGVIHAVPVQRALLCPPQTYNTP